jgi:hypothetical protein
LGGEELVDFVGDLKGGRKEKKGREGKVSLCLAASDMLALLLPPSLPPSPLFKALTVSMG